MSASSRDIPSMTFPYEIFDEIIGAISELDESRTTMHLYSVVYLRMYNNLSYTRFRHLLRTLRNSPHISTRVRELTVSDGIEQMPGGILRLLPIFLAWKLPNLDVLTLLGEGTLLELHPVRLTRIIRTDFHRILVALPYISDLKLDGVVWQDLREACVHHWPGYQPNVHRLSSLCMTDIPKADTEYPPFTYRPYMLLLLSVLGSPVNTLLLDIDAFYKNMNIVEELPNVPPILFCKRLQSLTLRYCWKFKPTESPPEGFLLFLDRLRAPSLRTLHVVLQLRPKRELENPAVFFEVGKNIDSYATRVSSLAALKILFVFDLNFLLEWDKGSVKQRLAEQFVSHPAFERWRRASVLYTRGVLTIKIAIVRLMLDQERDTGYWDVFLWEYKAGADQNPTPSPFRIVTMPAYSYGVDFERLIPKLLDY